MNKKHSGPPKSGVVSQADYKLLAEFRQALREFLHFSEQAASAAGVPHHQHQAMLVIRGLSSHNRVTVGELASRLKVRHQSAVGLVNRMVRRGFVRKSPVPADHRQVFVRLTPAGAQVLRGLSATHKAEIGRLGPGLQATLRRLRNIA